MSQSLPYLYDYKPYDNPRKGLFLSDEDAKYVVGFGWQRKEVVEMVIGEDSHTYVTRAYESEVILENERHPKGTKVMCTVGYHKTRLIKWLDTQLSLIDQIPKQ